MSTSLAQLTPDSLLSLPELEGGGHYELSDGELIVVGNAGALHELIKAQLYELLTAYRFRTASGRAFSETQFTLRGDRARIPDVAWLSSAKVSLIARENRAISVIPDIAIEVISDSETPQTIDQKLRDYLEAGVEVWQVFPSTQSVTVWRGDLGRRFNSAQLLTSDHLPDFSVAISEIFA